MTSVAPEHDLFTELVGAAHVRVADASDAVCGVVPSLVVSPADEEEVASVLSAATARGLAVVARGGGTKIDWGWPPERCDVVLSTSRIEGIVDHEPADLVCVVRAGTTLSHLQETLASAPGFRQRLMLDPPQGDAATIGGMLATAASGPLRTRFGTPRDLVIGASFVLSDGTVGRSGGKVVKNVAGFDVAKLLIGSLGNSRDRNRGGVPAPSAAGGIAYGRLRVAIGARPLRVCRACRAAPGDAERGRPPLAGGGRRGALRQLRAGRRGAGRARYPGHRGTHPRRGR